MPWGDRFGDAIAARLGLGADAPKVRFAERDAYKKARLNAKLARRLRYGKSTKSALDTIVDSMARQDRLEMAQSQLGNRFADNVWGGTGKYRRRRAPLRRRRRYVRGRGAYGMPTLKATQKVARSTGRWMGAGAAGAAAMGAPQIAAGLSAGSAGLAAFGGSGMYVGGRGSYNVSGNALIDGMGSSVPQFKSVSGDETGGMNIVHEEFVMDIYANEWANGKPVETFHSTNFSLNPGLSRSFPFLSQTSVNFEEYEIVQLMYTYKSKVSENLSSTDGQVGSLLMYTEYNSLDQPKTSKQQIMQGYGNSNARIIDTVMHGVECDPSKINGDGQKYIRNKPVKDGSNMNDYDHGLFQVVVCNTPEALSNQVIGELYVSYNIRLRKPRTYSLYGLNLDRDEFLIDGQGIGAFGANTVYDPPGPDKTLMVVPGNWNSIGCILRGAHVVYDFYPGAAVGLFPASPQIPKGYKLIFPASFSGDVVIEFTELNDDDTFGEPASEGGGSIIPRWPVMTGEVTMLQTSPFEQVHNDIKPGVPTLQTATRAWNDTLGVVNGVDQKPSIYNSKFYIHVEMASSGVENAFYFTGLSSIIEHNRAMVQVTRYNGRESTTHDPALRKFPKITL